jgi:GGDEF domain-containing protein
MPDTYQRVLAALNDDDAGQALSTSQRVQSALAEPDEPAAVTPPSSAVTLPDWNAAKVASDTFDIGYKGPTSAEIAMHDKSASDPEFAATAKAQYERDIQRAAQAKQNAILKSEGVGRFADAAQTKARLEKSWLGKVPVVGDALVSGATGVASGLMDLASTGSNLIGADELSKDIRTRSQTAGAADASRYAPDSVTGWLAARARNIGNAAPKMLLGGGTAGGATVFGLDGATEAAQAADDAGVEGSKKYAYVASVGIANALQGMLFGKLFGGAQSVSKATLLSALKSDGIKTALEGIAGNNAVALVNHVAGIVTDVDKHQWTPEDVVHDIVNNSADAVAIHALGVAARAADFGRTDPEKAQAIIEGEPSRSTFESAGLGDIKSKADREAFRAEVGRILKDIRGAYQDQGAVQTEEGAPRPSTPPADYPNRLNRPNQAERRADVVPSESPAPSPIDQIWAMSGELKRMPTAPEIAERLGTDPETADYLLRKAQQDFATPKPTPPGAAPTDLQPPRTLEIPRPADPYALQPADYNPEVRPGYESSPTLPVDDGPPLIPPDAAALASMSRADLAAEARKYGIKHGGLSKDAIAQRILEKRQIAHAQERQFSEKSIFNSAPDNTLQEQKTAISSTGMDGQVGLKTGSGSVTFDLRREIASRLGKHPDVSALHPEMLNGPLPGNEAVTALAQHVGESPTADAAVIGIDIKNQKGVNDFYGDPTGKAADRGFLAPAARILKEEVDRLPGVRATMIKHGGDEWMVAINSDSTIDHAALAEASKRADARLQELARSEGIPLDLENPRAKKPKYLREGMTPENQRIYDEQYKGYTEARGLGFRIGVTEVRPSDTPETVFARIGEQHEALKKGQEIDYGKPGKTGEVGTGGPEGAGAGEGTGAADRRTAEGVGEASQVPPGAHRSSEEAPARASAGGAEAVAGSSHEDLNATAREFGLKVAGLSKEAKQAKIDDHIEYFNSGISFNPEEIRDIEAGIGELNKAAKAIVAPASISEKATLGANITREHAAHMTMVTQQNEAAFKDLRTAMNKLPRAAQLAFIDKMEAGQKQPTPELDAAAKQMRDHLDSQRGQVQALGTGKLQQFITDYFPHIWKDPAKAQNMMNQLLSKKPLEGSKAFLKQRTIPTIADGIAMGLEPESTNPVDMVLLKSREIEKYLMGQRLMQEWTAKGLTKEVAHGGRVPAGYTRINDNVARTAKGNLYAETDVARILNNYLSPGLAGNKLYDAYRVVGNTLNQAQLGLSAFHLGMVGLDSSVSQVAVGLRQASKGHVVDAAFSIPKALIAPFTTLVEGNKMLKEYLKPGSQGADMAKLVDSYVAGGGRIGQDPFYHNQAWKKLQQAWKDNRGIETIARLPGAVLETATKPIMELFVPRMKAGVFARMAAQELADMPPNASRDEVRAVMAKVVDSVDNRMGQLTYDNLFWDKAVKDLSMASVRSVGWNLGTVRELGGGGKDLVTEGLKVLKGQKPELTHRAAYLIALPITVGLAGGVMHYLMTGRRPDDERDYFFPSTGRKNPDGNEERVQLPSYMKDLFAYSEHPVDTLKHKLHPMLGVIADMLENKDYWGNEIFSGKSEKVIPEAAAYLGKQAMPFSISNMLESGKRGQGTAEKVGSFLGLSPAPRDRVRTPAQNLIQQFITQGGGPRKAKTPDEVATAEQREKLKQAIRSGQPLTDAVNEAVGTGKVTLKQAVTTAKQAKEDPRVVPFKMLDVVEASQVLKLASQDEKALWESAYQDMIAAKAKTLARSKPLSGDKEHPLAERRLSWQADVDQARDELRAAGVTKDETIAAYRKAMKGKDYGYGLVNIRARLK